MRNAECKVFDKLESELGPGYVVFYSRPWHGLTPQGNEIDGECDFIVAHPQYGVLFIEVKGGVISHDPASSKWTSTDRYQIVHTIKNPVEQARSSKHNLLRKLKDTNSWPTHWVHLCHGVIFPDCEVPAHDLGADMPREIFCDGNQFNNSFKTWIKDRLCPNAAANNCNPIGSHGIAALEELLAQPISLHRPLIFDVDDNDRVITALTQNQFIILNSIQNIRRAAISGGAGTGKTVLAQEEAIRCSKEELSTLFVCYNSALAKQIQKDLADYPDIPVHTFHSLCGYLARESGQPLEKIPGKDFYDEILPEALINATEILSHMKYDVIIVDEGQDFREHWWVALDGLLKENAKLRVFWDCNQAVYGEPSLPQDTNSIDIPLNKNLRNSKHIFDIIKTRYKGTPLHPTGPDGYPVEWLKTADITPPIDVTSITIKRLIEKEKIPPKDIAILIATEAEQLKQELIVRLPDISFDNSHTDQSDCVVVDTIRRFKGLERPIVVIVATEQLTTNQQLQYIGFSRARTHLVIVGSNNDLSQLSTTQIV
ncbi:NERD domain-containing protein [Pseudodesulfovibrio profundus]|nr:NERD domain-containing protein/DEAD/DEAH box helicase [Pseudodesulfovibrio profundus]